MRLKAAWMDLMPIFTAQSPSFRQSVQDASARTIARHQQAAGARAPPPALLNEDDPTVLRQYIQGMQDRQRDAFPFGDNLIAQFFIIQSELSDQQRERLMSLRNISLENYSYEMLKTHYHELFITTRTSIQDPSILKEATEATHSSSSNKVNMKEKKASGLRMKKGLKDSCQTTMKRRSGSSRRTMRS